LENKYSETETGMCVSIGVEDVEARAKPAKEMSIRAEALFDFMINP